MATLKETMIDKAKSNIDKAQEKDKEYYDKKHSDPRDVIVPSGMFCEMNISIISTGILSRHSCTSEEQQK